MVRKTSGQLVDELLVYTDVWGIVEALIIVVFAVLAFGIVWPKTEDGYLLTVTIAAGVCLRWLVDRCSFLPWVYKKSTQIIETACQEHGGQPDPEASELVAGRIQRVRWRALIQLLGAIIGAFLGYLVVSLLTPGDPRWWVLGSGIVGMLAAPYVVPTVSADNSRP